MTTHRRVYVVYTCAGIDSLFNEKEDAIQFCIRSMQADVKRGLDDVVPQWWIKDLRERGYIHLDGRWSGLFYGVAPWEVK